jgi:hypothetical protein
MKAERRRPAATPRSAGETPAQTAGEDAGGPQEDG